MDSGKLRKIFLQFVKNVSGIGGSINGMDMSYDTQPQIITLFVSDFMDEAFKHYIDAMQAVDDDLKFDVRLYAVHENAIPQIAIQYRFRSDA